MEKFGSHSSIDSGIGSSGSIYRSGSIRGSLHSIGSQLSEVSNVRLNVFVFIYMYELTQHTCTCESFTVYLVCYHTNCLMPVADSKGGLHR